MTQTPTLMLKEVVIIYLWLSFSVLHSAIDLHDSNRLIYVYNHAYIEVSRPCLWAACVFIYWNAHILFQITYFITLWEFWIFISLIIKSINHNVNDNILFIYIGFLNNWEELIKYKLSIESIKSVLFIK